MILMGLESSHLLGVVTVTDDVVTISLFLSLSCVCGVYSDTNFVMHPQAICAP